MDLYARVNILDGRSVRLPRGDVETAIALHNDPIARIRSWFDQGVDHVHIVDLDAAAYDDRRNRDLIDKILEVVEGDVQVSGGIRSHVEAARLLDKGAWRIVMGTAAIEDQNMVWELCREYPVQVSVALDVHPDEQLATRGWKHNSGRYLEEVMIEMESAGAASFLVAEVGRDALVDAPNFHILTEAVAAVEEPVIAAGGVRNLDDLRRLVGLSVKKRRLGGVVVGREVSQGRFTVAEARQVLSEAPEIVDAPDVEEPAEASTTTAPSPSASPLLMDLAASYKRLAEECEAAAVHARRAASRFADSDAAEGAAHAFASQGHLHSASDSIKRLAAQHAEHHQKD
ncbi:MAG: hypothetical protein GEU79_06440 [Acidimicrobiia bacterium]|nr:hypothetical protein [Acidimicrobiia bacterium]